MRDVIRHWVSTDRKFSGIMKNLLGFYPRNLNLYRMAFRHRSVIRSENKESPTSGQEESNERLELLGDAFLGAIVAEHLFSVFPFKDEGFLTKMRSKVVSRHHLNAISRKMGIPELMNIDTSNFTGSSVYGNALEALIGSIYLDMGYNKTKQFVLNRLFKLYINLAELETTETDFKSKLIEWSQKEKKDLEFKVLSEPRNSGARVFHVGVLVDNSILGEGSHYSKKRAEQIAAEKAYESIVKNNMVNDKAQR